MGRPKSIVGLIGALALAITTLAGPGVPSAAGAASCSVQWGSRAETDQTTRNTSAARVRAGRHRCFDRIVIDQRGPVTGYDVRYVRVVRRDGSGTAVPVAGGARLQVITRAGRWSRLPVPSVRGYDTFRQIRYAGSSEGESMLALGVRARLPFRVFTLRGPGPGRSRLVVDVAHRW